MKLKDIGEFGLIDRLAAGVKTGRSVIKGIGDDAAVIKCSGGTYLLATVDMLIEDRHFKRSAAPESVGWKALCCGISDIAAMGGSPKWALASCGFTKDLDVKYVDGIYRGIKKAAKKFGVNIVGGDTNSSDKIILDITVLGEAKNGRPVFRSGARPGDLIFVTGELGGSIKGKHLKFMPRLKESAILVKNFKINSMIDISDGLSSDLNHILEESNAGALVYEYLIPVSAKAGSVANALSDGEDFELLFTMSKKEGGRLLDLRHRLFDIPVTRIGTVAEKTSGSKIADIFGKKRDLVPEGFRHF